MQEFTVSHVDADEPWVFDADNHQDAARQWGQHVWDNGSDEFIAVKCAFVEVSDGAQTLFFEINVLDDEEAIANERSEEEYRCVSDED